MLRRLFGKDGACHKACSGTYHLQTTYTVKNLLKFNTRYLQVETALPWLQYWFQVIFVVWVIFICVHTLGFTFPKSSLVTRCRKKENVINDSLNFKTKYKTRKCIVRTHLRYLATQVSRACGLRDPPPWRRSSRCISRASCCVFSKISVCKQGASARIYEAWFTPVWSNNRPRKSH